MWPSMYPPGDATTIDVAGPAEQWEGEARPGHFRGVATVCARLFGQVRPDRAYFGEKDWQQLQVVRRMVADLHLPLDIVGVADGARAGRPGAVLAQPVPDDGGSCRGAATVRRPAGHRARTGIRRGSRRAAEFSVRRLEHAGFRVDYVALVDGPTLQPLAVTRAPARLIAAARLGSVRLLDNVAV